MIEDRPPVTDLDRPRSVVEVVTTALSLYGRYPLLFGLLALVVVAPYELIVLAVAGVAPLARESLSTGTGLTLVLIDLALIGPLVSALDAHALAIIGRRQQPGLISVARLGARSLPVVAAAQIVAGIGIALGAIAFVIPGVILALRWAVVAQAAAIEHTDWMGALRRSGELTRGHYLHVLALIALMALVNYGIDRGGQALAGTSTHAGPVALGILLETVGRSLVALTTTVLYFDLVAREAGPRRARPEDQLPGDYRGPAS